MIMSQNVDVSKNGPSVIEALLFGSASGTMATVAYQPLELLKTRLQLHQTETKSAKIFGRALSSSRHIIYTHGIGYLWRGTGPSLLRSIPGVGLYYGSLTILQKNFSSNHDRPNDATQALYFGITARSFVSFILLPVTVIKVRYESGLYSYDSLASAIKESYIKTGWIGLAPTLLRDSIFSGIYYMCYTKLKSNHRGSELKVDHFRNFTYGILSGLVASVITNPIDVIKTHVQIKLKSSSMIMITKEMVKEKGGYVRLFDGLAVRSVRRTLIAATTWTLYEFIQDLAR